MSLTGSLKRSLHAGLDLIFAVLAEIENNLA